MIEAIIFDMDGVISDTQKIHSTIESDLLKQHGVYIRPEEITARFSGVDDREFVRKMSKEHGTEIDFETFKLEKSARLFPLLKQGVDPIPGAIKLIHECRKEGLRLGLASASRTEIIRMILGQLKLGELFHAITSGKEVEKGKPDPGIFLLTAQKLWVHPEKCIVIEDGISGMLGAKRAGMRCVGLVTDPGLNRVADMVVTSLEQLTVAKIFSYFSEKR